MSSEQKLTVRFYPSDPCHRRALEILQLRASLYRKSYGDTIAAAIVGYYGADRQTDDDLAEKIAAKVAERLTVRPPVLARPEEPPEVPASDDTDIDIDWSFLGG